MNDKPAIDQSGQTTNGPQTNVSGDVRGPLFSGHFQIQGDFIYNEALKLRLPFQRPQRVPHFTGREAELASLLRNLQPGRAVTICGPGGMGKTALAAEAIWQLAPASDPPQLFPDGIVLHAFYHRPQSALALEEIARAFGEDPRQSPLDAAKRALAGRRALIVLDGAEACDDLQTVLSVTGSCGVLITTRRRSDAPEEPSDLLPLPEDKAVELLQAWGGSMAADARICRSICNLLSCLPLAIFLAGRYLAHRRQLAGDYLAWLKETPLEALDMGKRPHQSIPLLMDHSLEQVSEQARACFGLAGVMALKPFEPEVVAIALQISAQKANISLGELVDYGLLTRPDSRYQITHALAHAYARERLPVQSDALTRLAQHYNKLSREQTKQGLPGYGLLDAHRDHILAIQSACNKVGLWEEVRSLAWAVKDYLDLQGHSGERVALLLMGLEAARSEGASYDEASFLTMLGLASADLGNARKAIDYHKQSLKVFHKIGKKQGEGAALGNLGLAYANLGDAHQAIEYYEQALAILRKIGDQRGEGATLGNMGLAYAALGDARKAIEYYEQALSITREIGGRRNEGAILDNLGLAYAALGDVRKAIEYYEQQLAITREIGDRRGEANACWNLGLEYEKAGDLKQAAEMMQICVDYEREIGHPDAENDAAHLEALRAKSRNGE
jgi:tetratricopeptide (TPR) repeat protein